MQNHLQPDIYASENERGAILVVVLVLIFAVTLALLAFLYLNKNNSLIASNLAVENAAQEATDYGLSAATKALSPPLNSKPTLDVMPNTGYLAPGVTAASAPLQPPTDPTFWKNCVGNNECVLLPAVHYGPYSFEVEYVTFTPITTPQCLPGYECSQASGPLATFYPVFVHAARSSGGGLSVTVQSVIRIAGG